MQPEAGHDHRNPARFRPYHLPSLDRPSGPWLASRPLGSPTVTISNRARSGFARHHFCAPVPFAVPLPVSIIRSWRLVSKPKSTLQYSIVTDNFTLDWFRTWVGVRSPTHEGTPDAWRIMCLRKRRTDNFVCQHPSLRSLHCGHRRGQGEWFREAESAAL